MLFNQPGRLQLILLIGGITSGPGSARSFSKKYPLVSILQNSKTGPDPSYPCILGFAVIPRSRFCSRQRLGPFAEANLAAFCDSMPPLTRSRTRLFATELSGDSVNEKTATAGQGQVTTPRKSVKNEPLQETHLPAPVTPLTSAVLKGAGVKEEFDAEGKSYQSEGKENVLKTPTKKARAKSSKSPSSPSRKKSSPRKRIKIEPGSLEPPANWEKVYSLVEELRSDRSAPVDVEGGHLLPEKHLGEAVFRFQVLVALMLSSQTKDAVTAETIRNLQKHGLTIENIINTEHETLNSLIRKVGFHNNKTKFIKQTAEILSKNYNGDIPPTAEKLMELPGVGPKMAYIVESVAFQTTSGIGVDTHMHRMFNDLKWVNSTSPEQTRIQLEGWLPRERWAEVNVLWVGFGQEVQQQKEKILKKALACSSPREALGLIHKLRYDVKKEGKRFGLEEEIKKAMNKQ